MADTMQFDLVSPERKLASGEASAVSIPGAEGDLTAMPDHTPVITTLRPGILRATVAGATQEFVVSGGFAEITPKSVSVLAERAMAREDVTAAFLDTLAEEANSAETPPEMVDAQAKTVADIAALRAEIGM